MRQTRSAAAEYAARLAPPPDAAAATLAMFEQQLARGGQVVMVNPPEEEAPPPPRRIRRALWRNRHRLAPAGLVLAVAAAGAGMAQVDGGANLTLLAAGLAAAGVNIGPGRRWVRARLDRCIERRYAALIGATATGLISYAAAYGPLATLGPARLPTVTAVAGGLLAVPWWRHHPLPRPKAPGDPAAVGPGLEQMEDPIEVWNTYVGNPGGVLPGSYLAHVDRTLYGWEGLAGLVRGKQTYPAAIGQSDLLHSAYDAEIGTMSFEAPPSRKSAWLKISYFKDNPLRTPVDWPGPHLFDATTGRAPIGVYPALDWVTYEMWRAGFGPVHDLFAGDSGSGKSRLIDLLLGYERHARCPVTGRKLVCSVVLDPQMGQSLPEWVGQVAAYARGMDECIQLLYAVYDAMLARNDYMSKMRWIDEKGRTRTGRSLWAPPIGHIPDGLDEAPPLLSLTIEEAPQLLAVDEARALIDSIVVMFRKCGGKVRIVTQSALLDELRSNLLRKEIRGGNVWAGRTSERLAASAAFADATEVSGDPSTLPKTFDDGTTTAGLGYVSGGVTRSALMRNCWVRDPYDVATEGETTPLWPLDQRAGDPYWSFQGAVGEDRVASGRRPAVPEGAPEPPAEADTRTAPIVVGDRKLRVGEEKVLRALAATAAGHVASRGELMAATQLGSRAVNTAAVPLIQLGLVAKPRQDNYVVTEAGRGAVPAAE